MAVRNCVESIEYLLKSCLSIMLDVSANYTEPATGLRDFPQTFSNNQSSNDFKLDK